MSRWFAMRPCDGAYFDSAPQVYRYPMQLPVPPSRVWDSLTS